MKQITKLTSEANQQLTITGEAGEQIILKLIYMPTQQLWQFGIVYNDFEINGVQLGRGPNLLRNYRKLLPFGLMCDSTDGFDPYYITDFVTGRVKLYLLSSANVQAVEDGIF